MPNRYFKILLSVLAFTTLSALRVNAQLYYCVTAGTELTPSTSIMLVYVSGNKCYVAEKTASEISSKLYSDRYYWVSWMSQQLSNTGKPATGEPYVYDSSLSTTSYTVYKQERRGVGQAVYTPGTWVPGYGYKEGSCTWTYGPLFGFNYRAISKDGKTIIGWRQGTDSQAVLDKVYYEIVNPDELNKDPHDFLK